jgi:hypothetical protein
MVSHVGIRCSNVAFASSSVRSVRTKPSPKTTPRTYRDIPRKRCPALTSARSLADSVPVNEQSKLTFIPRPSGCLRSGCESVSRRSSSMRAANYARFSRFTSRASELSGSVVKRSQRHLCTRVNVVDVKTRMLVESGYEHSPNFNATVPIAPTPKAQPANVVFDDAGRTIIAMLQKASEVANEDCARAMDAAHKLSIALHAVEGRVREAEAEVARVRERATRAEAWLVRIHNEVEQVFLPKGRAGVAAGAYRAERPRAKPPR